MKTDPQITAFCLKSARVVYFSSTLPQDGLNEMTLFEDLLTHTHIKFSSAST